MHPLAIEILPEFDKKVIETLSKISSDEIQKHYKDKIVDECIRSSKLIIRDILPRKKKTLKELQNELNELHDLFHETIGNVTADVIGERITDLTNIIPENEEERSIMSILLLYRSPDRYCWLYMAVLNSLIDEFHPTLGYIPLEFIESRITEMDWYEKAKLFYDEEVLET